jgi:hypothetical protein
MAVDLTWRNIFTLVALAATLFSALVAGTGAMIQWRFDALQAQLTDRMNLYAREVDAIQARLDRLESARR